MVSAHRQFWIIYCISTITILSTLNVRPWSLIVFIACKILLYMYYYYWQDLGSGWGSLSVYIAEHFPDCRITTVSNSRTQQVYIKDKAASRGWGQRFECITADANTFTTDKKFDRILSLEMLEVNHVLCNVIVESFLLHPVYQLFIKQVFHWCFISLQFWVIRYDFMYLLGFHKLIQRAVWR